MSSSDFKNGKLKLNNMYIDDRMSEGKGNQRTLSNGSPNT